MLDNVRGIIKVLVQKLGFIMFDMGLVIN